MTPDDAPISLEEDDLILLVKASRIVLEFLQSNLDAIKDDPIYAESKDALSLLSAALFRHDAAYSRENQTQPSRYTLSHADFNELISAGITYTKIKRVEHASSADPILRAELTKQIDAVALAV